MSQFPPWGLELVPGTVMQQISFNQHLLVFELQSLGIKP
jgi:hypothetical protein